jgi:hypothetical protein
MLAPGLDTPGVEISWGARDVLRILITKAANPADSSQALLEGHKSAVRATAAVVRTPGIVQGFGTSADASRNCEYAHREQ